MTWTWFPVLLALCVGSQRSPVDSPHKWPLMSNVDVFLDVLLLNIKCRIITGQSVSHRAGKWFVHIWQTISARFFFYFRKVYLSPHGFVHFRKVCFISARLYYFRKVYFISARLFLFPRGLFLFRKVGFRNLALANANSSTILFEARHYAKWPGPTSTLVVTIENIFAEIKITLRK